MLGDIITIIDLVSKVGGYANDCYNAKEELQKLFQNETNHFDDVLTCAVEVMNEVERKINVYRELGDIFESVPALQSILVNLKNKLGAQAALVTKVQTQVDELKKLFDQYEKGKGMFKSEYPHPKKANPRLTDVVAGYKDLASAIEKHTTALEKALQETVEQSDKIMQNDTIKPALALTFSPLRNLWILNDFGKSATTQSFVDAIGLKCRPFDDNAAQYYLDHDVCREGVSQDDGGKFMSPQKAGKIGGFYTDECKGNADALDTSSLFGFAGWLESKGLQAQEKDNVIAKEKTVQEKAIVEDQKKQRDIAIEAGIAKGVQELELKESVKKTSDEQKAREEAIEKEAFRKVQITGLRRANDGDRRKELELEVRDLQQDMYRANNNANQATRNIHTTQQQQHRQRQRHNGPRCNDGSLNMKFAENKGLDKYND